MKIAILGTKGIPNNYGGFEQFAECISVILTDRGHDVTVYSPHYHPYKKKLYKGVKIRSIYSPENRIGAAGNFVYDFLCLKDALKIRFDVILECGYHSNAPSYYLLGRRKSPVIITNMDGLEWKRSKWNFLTRWLIRKLEKVAVQKSHYLVSDNIAIQKYYRESFNRDSTFIAYGATPVESFDENRLTSLGLHPGQYYLVIARLEPENNIEMILSGFLQSESTYPFVVVGKQNTKYGKYLEAKYGSAQIKFVGGIYDKESLDSLRHYACGYFHGHSVGGTNPSLLEAMASNVLILAHDNEFNRQVLHNNAYFFSGPTDVGNLIRMIEKGVDTSEKIENNDLLIRNKYSWETITDQYEQLFRRVTQ